MGWRDCGLFSKWLASDAAEVGSQIVRRGELFLWLPSAQHLGPMIAAPRSRGH